MARNLDDTWEKFLKSENYCINTMVIRLLCKQADGGKGANVLMTSYRVFHNKCVFCMSICEQQIKDLHFLPYTHLMGYWQGIF